VNKLIQDLIPDVSFTITTLKDVRRHIFSEFHPRAFELSGENFVKLKKINNPKEKIAMLATLLQVDKTKLQQLNIDQAYQGYYRKELNSGTPKDYSKILEALWEKKILSQQSRNFLITTMINTKTGKNRIKAGLKSPWIFAHKTGTQHQLISDVGFIWDTNNIQRRPIIIVSFVRGIEQKKRSEKLLATISKIISESGVL
jgi:beta-lactamase class A